MPDGGIAMVRGQYLFNVAVKSGKEVGTLAKSRYHQANANLALV